MLCFLEAPEIYNPGCSDLQGGELETERPLFSFWEDEHEQKLQHWKSTESPHNRLHPFPEMAPEGFTKYSNPDNTAAAETRRGYKGSERWTTIVLPSLINSNSSLNWVFDSTNRPYILFISLYEFPHYCETYIYFGQL